MYLIMNVTNNKAIILKGKGRISVVEIIISKYGQEAPNSCDHFETAFSSVPSDPWIARVPDSGQGTDLDIKRKEMVMAHMHAGTQVES